MSETPKQNITVVLTRADLELAGRLVGLGITSESAIAFHKPNVIIDSRKAEPGCIFVALKGEQTDGHNYVWGAIKNGAALCVVSQTWFDGQDQTQLNEKLGSAMLLVVSNPLVALQTLATFYRRKFNIPVIAIAGSNGKTTTKEMIAQVLSQSFKVKATKGNFNNHIGAPLTLFDLEPETEIAVLELGINHPGEMMALCRIVEPTHGLITNIGHEHTEFFKSKELVAKAEGELFAYLKSNKGELFVNAEEELIASQAYGYDLATYYGKDLTYKNFGLWKEEAIQHDNGTYSFVLRNSKYVDVINLRIGGMHNVKNAFAAACVAKSFRVPFEKIVKALSEYSPAKGSMRMEREVFNEIVFINDAYNANPESMSAAIDFLNRLNISGKRFAVLGDMLELGEISNDAHEEIGKQMSETDIEHFFAFGPQMEAACKSAPQKCNGWFMEKSKLIKTLTDLVKPGDALLLKGSRGMRMEEILNKLKENLGQLNSIVEKEHAG